MTGEDNAVRIIGSDSERRENGEMGEEEHRSEPEEKAKSGEEVEEGLSLPTATTMEHHVIMTQETAKQTQWTVLTRRQ